MPWKQVNGKWEWYSTKQQQKEARDTEGQRSRSQAAMKNQSAIQSREMKKESTQAPSFSQPKVNVGPTFEPTFKLIQTLDQYKAPQSVQPSFKPTPTQQTMMNQNPFDFNQYMNRAASQPIQQQPLRQQPLRQYPSGQMNDQTIQPAFVPDQRSSGQKALDALNNFFTNQLPEAGKNFASGLVNAFGLDDLLARGFQQGMKDPNYKVTPEDFQEDPSRVKYIPKGVAEGAQVTGQIVGTIPQYIGGMGATKAVPELTKQVLKNAPQWLQKGAAFGAQGAAAGGLVGAGQEIMDEIGAPERETLGQHATDVAKHAGYGAAYGALSPIVGRGLEVAGQKAFSKLPESVRGSMESLGKTTIGEIGKGAVEGAITGGLVGAGAGTYDAIKTGDPSKILSGAIGESGEEIHENIVEAIAFGVARRLSGRFSGIPVDQQVITQKIQERTPTKLPDETKEVFDTLVEALKEEGISEQEAKTIAIQEIAQTQEGEEILNSVQEEIEKDMELEIQNTSNVVVNPEIKVNQKGANQEELSKRTEMPSVDVKNTGDANTPSIQKEGTQQTTRSQDRLQVGDYISFKDGMTGTIAHVLKNGDYRVIPFDESGMFTVTASENPVKVEKPEGYTTPNRMQVKQPEVTIQTTPSSENQGTQKTPQDLLKSWMKDTQTNDVTVRDIGSLVDMLPKQPVQEEFTTEETGDDGAVTELTNEEQQELNKLKQVKKFGPDLTEGQQVKLKGKKDTFKIIGPSGKNMWKLQSPKGGELTVHRAAIEEVSNVPEVNQEGTKKEEISKPENKANQPSLPDDLKHAKPRYNYRDKQFQLEFESDIDKAHYIVRKFSSDGKNMSKRDDDYMSFLRNQFPDSSDYELRQEGERIASYIKGIAKDAEPGVLKVPTGARSKSFMDEMNEQKSNEVKKDVSMEGKQDVQDENVKKDQEVKEEKSDESRVLRNDGERTLEETPSEDVQGTREKRPVDENNSGNRSASERTDGDNQDGSREEVSGDKQDDTTGSVPTPELDSSDSVGNGKRSDSSSRRGNGGVKRDFVITSELDDLGGAKTKFKNNIAALRLLSDLETTGRMANEEEQATLAKYVGWGVLANSFKEGTKEYEELQSLIQDGFITQEEFEEARRSTQYAHYTSKEIVGAMYNALEQFGFKGGRVLEPAVGTGNFFGLMPSEMNNRSVRIGVEMDTLTSKLAKHLYQKATIHNKPFQDFKIADGYFDAAIGNPPFSGNTLAYESSRVQLHNYFFLKSLDKVRDGGIVAFVTSSGTMNAKSGENIRQMMADKADFLGAIRLPGDAFKKNAGTEVTADIIFFQKRPKGEGPSMQKPKHAGAFVKTYKQKVKDKDGNEVEVDNNVYFGQHPEMVLGEYTVDKLTGKRLGVKSDGRDFEKALSEAIQKLPKDIYVERQDEVEESEQSIVESGFFDLSTLDEGGLGVKDGQIIQRVGDTLIQVQPKDAKTAARLKSLIKVRDAAKKVLRDQYEGVDDNTLSKSQGELNKLYDRHIKEFGYLNQQGNISAFKDDIVGSSLLRSLEDYQEDGTGKNKKVTVSKRDIFSKRTIQKQSRADKADTAEEALVISLFERGRIDFDHMAKLTGKNTEDLKKELEGRVFKNPSGGWETADEYLSGNVREKLRKAEEAAKDHPEFKDNVEALKAVIPEDLGADEIAVRLGSPWIPAKDIADFINEFFGLSPGTVKVSHVPLLGKWNIDDYKVPSNNLKNREEFGAKGEHRSKTAIEIIEDLLNLKTPTVTYTHEEKTYVDQEATQEAIAKSKELQDAFREWIWSNQDRMVRLTRKYNDEFNSVVLREFDGELIYGKGNDHKPIPGFNQAKYKLRPHQKNAVWRVAQGGNTLLAHVVGAGKTLEMIVSGMEMKRLGLVNKPMYVVPNHLLDQWEHEFLDAYPGANILKLSSDDIPASVVQRRELSEEVKSGEPIPTGTKVKLDGNTKKYTVEGVVGNEVWLTDSKGKKSKAKRSEVTHRYRKMTNDEFNELRNARRVERGQALNKIAVGNYDAILITHKTFEKLPVSPELVNEHIKEQVKIVETAINAAKEDKEDTRSIKQLEKLKENLENRLKESYDEESKDIAIPFEMLGIDQIFVDEAHMFKNLRVVSKQNIKGIPKQYSDRAEDMFLKTRWLTKHRGGKGVVFATGTPIANTMAEMYTMQRYLGMEDLESHDLGHFDSWAAAFGNTVSGIEMDATGGFKSVDRFAEFVNLPELMTMFKSFSDIKTADMLDLPRPKKVNYETIVAPMTEGQKAFLQVLQQRANDIKNGVVTPNEDNWLKLTGDGRKAALDLRMVMNDILAHTPEELRDQVRSEILKDHPESKINQAISNIHKIWKDTTAPIKDKHGKPIDRLAQLAFLDLGTPKAKAQDENGDDVNQEDNSEAQFSSVYQDIKDKLIKQGVPANEIAFIHEANTDIKKKKLFDKVRKGEIRVLIGSTEKMGAGMNVQDRLIALHHLDAPWRPADLEQREGRIIRQGNRNDEVHIFNYTTEGSFDALMWGILKKKATFIAQVMNGSSEARTIEDVGEFVAGFAHVEAITTGDTTVIEKYEADQKVNEFTRLKKQYDKNKTRYRQKIVSLPKINEEHKRRIKAYKKDLAARTDTKGDNFTITIGGKSFSDRKEAGEALNKIYLDQYDSLDRKESKEIGTFGGLSVFLYKGWTENFQLVGAETYGFKVNTDNPSGTVQSMEAALRNIDNDLSTVEKWLSDNEKELEEVKRLVEQPFNKEKEYKEALSLQAELTRRLMERNQDKQTIEVQEDEDGPSVNTFVPLRKETQQEQHKAGSKKSITRADILKFVIREFKVPIGVRRYVDRARAIFKPGVTEIRVKHFADYVAISHELGHRLDAQYGFSKMQEHYDELEGLAETNLQLDANMSRKEVRQEGVAEFMRLMVYNPIEAQRMVPDFYKFFVEKMTQEKKMPAIEKLSDMIMTWTEQSSYDRIKGVTSRSSKNSSLKKAFKKQTYSDLYTKVYDSLHGIEVAVRNLLKGEKIAASEDPFMVAWQTRGVDGKIKTFMEHGIVDDDGNKIFKSFEEILDGVKDIDEFEVFLVALRAHELKKSHGKSKTPVMTEDIKRVLTKEFGIEKSREYMKSAKDLYTFQDHILKELVKSGMLKQSDVEDMRARHLFYVPFKRVMDEDGDIYVSDLLKKRQQNKRFTSLQNPIMGMKKEGSDRNIISPLESIIRNTYLYMSLAERNKVGRAMADLIDPVKNPKIAEESAEIMVKVPKPSYAVNFSLEQISDKLEAAGVELDEINLEQVATIFKQVFMPSKAEKMLTVYRNGKQEFYQVRDEYLYHAFEALEPETIKTWVKILSIPNNILRPGITLSPAFIPKTFFRSIATMAMQSKSYSNPIDYMQLPFDLMKSWFQAVGKTDMYWKWMSSGAAQSTFLTAQESYLNDSTRKMLGNKMAEIGKDVATLGVRPLLRGLRWFSEKGDEAIRIAEYQKALKKGIDKTEAAIRSREVDLDFSRMGTNAKDLNRISLFFNVALQGPEKTFRTFKEKPFQTLLRGSLLITLPTWLLFLHNMDDEDYWELEEYERDLFWNIPMGDGKFFKIPIPFEWGLLFKTIPERVFGYMYKNNPGSLKGFAKEVATYSLPSIIPTVFLGYLSLMSNKDLAMSGNPIVPDNMKDDPVEDQYREYTSESAKKIGTALGLSPLKVEYAIKSYTGQMGDLGLSAGDLFIDAPVKPEGEGGVIDKVKRPFIGSGYDGSGQNIADFYDSKDKQEKDYKESGVKYNPPKRLSAMRKMQSEMATMRTIRKLIHESKDLSAKEKRGLIDQVNLALTDAARVMNKMDGSVAKDMKNLQTVRGWVDAYEKSEDQKRRQAQKNNK